MSAKVSDLRRLIRTVQRKLEAEIGALREELRESENGTCRSKAASAEGALQASEGVERLRTDLKTFRHLGIVDEHGKRVRPELPPEMVEEASDVV